MERLLPAKSEPLEPLKNLLVQQRLGRAHASNVAKGRSLVWSRGLTARGFPKQSGVAEGSALLGEPEDLVNPPRAGTSIGYVDRTLEGRAFSNSRMILKQVWVGKGTEVGSELLSRGFRCGDGEGGGGLRGEGEALQGCAASKETRRASLSPLPSLKNPGPTGPSPGAVLPP